MDDINFIQLKKELEVKLNNINIFQSIGFEKLYSEKKIDINIDQNTKEYETISTFLKYLNIRFTSYLPPKEELFPLPEIEEFEDLNEHIKYSQLTFGLETNFQSLYILIEILKNFGLEKVFYSNDKDIKVDLENNPKYFHDYNYVFFKAMNIEKILEMPFYYTTMDMLCDYHDANEQYILSETNRHIGDIQNRFDEENFERKNYDSDDERNSFNALTDGQNGDYDDWKDNGGNFDDLRD